MLFNREFSFISREINDTDEILVYYADLCTLLLTQTLECTYDDIMEVDGNDSSDDRENETIYSIIQFYNKDINSIDFISIYISRSKLSFIINIGYDIKTPSIICYLYNLQKNVYKWNKYSLSEE